MYYRLYSKPNLTWIVVPVLFVCWLVGFLNIWWTFGIFLVYFLIAFIYYAKDSAVQKEAQEFARQVSFNRQQKKKEKIFRDLQNSVKFKVAINDKGLVEKASNTRSLKREG